MKSLFSQEAFNEITTRLDNLNEAKTPLWGKMDVGQMVNHCQKPFNIMMQKEDYGLKPNWLIRVFFKKSLYNDKPWRKNLPTAPALKVASSKEFTNEKEVLLKLINEFKTHSNKTDWAPHPTFGAFTAQQWGQMQYKHLDHHLKQFGV